MRIFLAALFAIGTVIFWTNPLASQLHECDSCGFYGDPGGGGFAHCILGDGGPLWRCYQENPGFCSFQGLCMPEEDEAPELALTGGIMDSGSSIGEKSVTDRRPCDGSAVLRIYTSEEAAARRKALRRIVL